MVQLIEVPSVEFLERMSKFPVISTAMEYAVGTYGKAKVRTGPNPAPHLLPSHARL